MTIFKEQKEKKKTSEDYICLYLKSLSDDKEMVTVRDELYDPSCTKLHTIVNSHKRGSIII